MRPTCFWVPLRAPPAAHPFVDFRIRTRVETSAKQNWDHLARLRSKSKRAVNLGSELEINSGAGAISRIEIETRSRTVMSVGPWGNREWDLLGLTQNREGFISRPWEHLSTRLYPNGVYEPSLRRTSSQLRLLSQRMYALIWGCALLVVFYLYLRKKNSYFKDHGVNHLPPAPVFGNITKTILRMEHLVTNINKLYFAFPEDRFVGHYDFVSPTVMIRDLELLKLIGVKDFDYFTDHRAFTSDNDPVFAKSLFGLKGQKWRDMRSTLSPAFTGSKLRGMVPLIQDCSKNLVRYLKEEIKKRDEGYLDVNTKDLFTRYANDVIATCAFGLKVDSIAEKNNQFYRMGYKLTNFTYVQILKMFGILVFPFVNKITKIDVFPKDVTVFLKQLVLDTMANREENNTFRPDVIQILMEVKKGILQHENVKDDKDAGFATVEESKIGKTSITHAWDDDDLVAQAILFFLAGFDTVSTAMVFLMYELAVNEDVQTKLRQEIDIYYDKYQDKIDYDKINQMTYLDMVLSESLRKWPPVPGLDRECQKQYNLGKPNREAKKDFYLEKGASVVVPVWSIHHDPKYYPDPSRFDPERFSDDNKRNIKPFTYLPFGVGPRNCIGSRFALTEVKTMAFDLLRHFELSPASKTRVPAELDPSEAFTMRMLGGHWIRIRLRENK
ncbi:Cytochrome P450 9e2 [Eumeta japonica]|uniref:unspecific monooxygenase n=1 Tax=Eumeta variegata TaxID=151549 RepID=A0A4C1UKK7_EUMVA|nr:Cytochrome P450 9e2 [Eumeta japonica]